MTGAQVFAARFAAVNVALPVVLSPVLRLTLPDAARLRPVLGCAAILVVLNLWIAQRRFGGRHLVRGAIAGNLAATALVGTVGLVNALPALRLLAPGG